MRTTLDLTQIAHRAQACGRVWARVGACGGRVGAWRLAAVGETALTVAACVSHAALTVCARVHMVHAHGAFDCIGESKKRNVLIEGTYCALWSVPPSPSPLYGHQGPACITNALSPAVSIQ